MAKENPEVHKAMQANLAELTKNWPTAIAPAKPVKNPADVTKLVKTIEQDSQKVISSAT
jgi:hypothetical protein